MRLMDRMFYAKTVVTIFLNDQVSEGLHCRFVVLDHKHPAAVSQRLPAGLYEFGFCHVVRPAVLARRQGIC